ncbi:MAG: ATP-binding protein [bacterium]
MSPIPQSPRPKSSLPVVILAGAALIALAAPWLATLAAPRDDDAWRARESARLTARGEREAADIIALVQQLSRAAESASGFLRGDDAAVDATAQDAGAANSVVRTSNARASDPAFAFDALARAAGGVAEPPLRDAVWGILLDAGGSESAWWGEPRVAAGAGPPIGAFLVAGRLRSAAAFALSSPDGRRIVASASLDIGSPRGAASLTGAAARDASDSFAAHLVVEGQPSPPEEPGRPRAVVPVQIGGETVAHLVLDGATRAGDLAARRAAGAAIRFALLVPVVVLVAALVLSSARVRALTAAPRLAVSIAAIWAARVLLALVRVPPNAPGAELFRPDGFAGPAPLGLLRSPADVFLTMLALALSVRLIDRALRAGAPPRAGVAALVGACLALPLLWMRGVWGAASAIYASAPRLLDTPLPDMAPAPLLVLVAFVLGGFALFRAITILVRVAVVARADAHVALPQAFFSIVVAVVILRVLPQVAGGARIAGEPLDFFATWPLFALSLATATALAWLEARPNATDMGRGVLFLLGASLVLVPGVERGLEARDRDRVREVAARFAAPRDEWRRLVLEEALDFFTQRPRLVAALESGAPSDPENLAFAEWIESPLASLATECALEVLDASGAVVSRFAIGFPSEPGHEATFAFRDARERKRPVIRSAERRIGRETIDAYLGAAPLLTPDGRVAGAVVVTIPYFFENLAFATRPAAERPILFGSAAAARGPGGDGGETRGLEERLTVSRFEAGALAASSDPTLAPGIPLGDALAQPPFGDFHESRLYGRREATLVVPLPRGSAASGGGAPRRAADGDASSLLAFTLARGGPRETVERLIHVALIAAALILSRALVLITQRAARHQPYLVTFREKLLAAFLVIAIVPAVLMGVLTHELTTRRVADASQREAIEGLESVRALLNERSLAEARRLSETTLIRRLALGLEALGSIDLETGLKKFAIFGPRGEMLLQNGVVPLVPGSMVRKVASELSPVTFFSADDGLSVVSLVPIVFEGADQPGKGVLLLRTPVDSDLVTALGEEGNRDVIAYAREGLAASNRPELFQSEILPRRMPAAAYVDCFVYRKEAVFGSGSVAGQPYVVAYGSLAGLSGEPLGALAVPLLYRQREIDDTIARSLASILYVTVLVLAAVAFLATIVAERIAKPVAELSAGTKRVSRGELSFALRRSSGGELGELVDSFNRMTEELQRSRDRILERSRTIEAILGNITTGVLALDRDGRITTLNRGGARTLGLPDGAGVGKGLDFLRDGVRNGIADALEAIGSAPGGILEREIALPREALARASGDARGDGVAHDARDARDAHADPTLPGDRTAEPILAVRAVGTRLLNEAGEELGRVLVFEDLSELIRSKKLLAWSEMARQVAHEIKNPLTPMKLSAQHIREAYKDRAPEFGRILEEGTEAIISEIESLRRIATEFSSFARMPRRVLREEALNEIVEESVRLYREARAAALDVALDASAPRVRVDRAEMKRVLVNLVENAVHASAPGGRIRVRTLAPNASRAEVTAALPTDAARFVQWSRRVPADGAFAAVIIEDDGDGIPSEYRDRVFEPYFSTKTDGTGLGLAICKAIVEEHGGAIRVSSATGRGTGVMVLLPAVDV